MKYAVTFGLLVAGMGGLYLKIDYSGWVLFAACLHAFRE